MLYGGGSVDSGKLVAVTQFPTSPCNYWKLKKLSKESALLDGPNPEHWEQRISIFEQFAIDNTIPPNEIRDLEFGIQGQGIDSPLSIAMTNLPNVGELVATSTRLRNIRQIWQAS